MARLAPSASNTQPWHVAVVSGDARRRLEAAIFEEIDAGKVNILIGIAPVKPAEFVVFQISQHQSGAQVEV